MYSLECIEAFILTSCVLQYFKPIILCIGFLSNKSDFKIKFLITHYFVFWRLFSLVQSHVEMWPGLRSVQKNGAKRLLNRNWCVEHPVLMTQEL